MNNKKKLGVLAIAAVATSLFTLAPMASYAEGTDAAAAQVKCMMKDGTTSMSSEKDCTANGGSPVKDDASQSTSTTTTTNTTNTTTDTSTVGTDAKSMPNEPSSTNNGAMGNQPAAAQPDNTQQQSAPAGSQ